MTTQFNNNNNNIDKNSALLVMDFQTTILNNFLPQDRAEDVIRNTSSLISLRVQQAYRLSMLVLSFVRGILRLVKTI